jgi:hypothetical protein
MTRNNLSTTSTTAIAVAADYADAMMTARKAKNVLFLLLLLVLLIQLALFFLLKFNVLHLGDEVSAELTRPTAHAAAVTAATTPSTQPEAATQAAGAAEDADSAAPPARAAGHVEDILRYVIPVTDFVGITLAVVMAVVLLLIVTIMLVGRLIGVSHVTAAFIWCVVLAALLFPWQAFLAAPAHRAAGAAAGSSAYATDTGVRPPPPDFKIPGALYTWEEISYDIRHAADYETAKSGLKWVRYAGAPIAALMLLLMVQAKSSRGLKFALGESEVQVEVTT